MSVSSPCQLYEGTINSKGYGVVYMGMRIPGRTAKVPQVYAHRLAWALHNGADQEGFFVCHHCDTPACVNPEHLFLGTMQENNADKMRKGRQFKKTYCKRGHHLATVGRKSDRHCAGCRP